MGFDDWSFDNDNDNLDEFEGELEGFEDEFGGDFGDDEYSTYDLTTDDGSSSDIDFGFDTYDTGENEEEEGGAGKAGIILVILGILVIAVVGFVASRLVGKTEHIPDNGIVEEKDIEEGDNNYPVETNGAVVETESPENRHESNNNVSYNEKENSEWSEITSSEDVEIHEDYIAAVYTITGIKHIARKTDDSGSLEIKTTLKGSISGLGGTYELTLPYNKGIKVKFGDQFNVMILVGEYRSNLVLLDVKF